MAQNTPNTPKEAPRSPQKEPSMPALVPATKPTVPVVPASEAASISAPLPPAMTHTPKPTEAQVNSVTSLEETFQEFGMKAVEIAVLKQKLNALKLDHEKKVREYKRSKPHHEKFPSIEESGRKAMENIEKQQKAVQSELSKQNNDLKAVAFSAASKLPGLLAPVVSNSDSKLEQRFEDLLARFEDDKATSKQFAKDLAAETAARKQLEQKVSDEKASRESLEKANKALEKKLGEASTRLSKAESGIGELNPKFNKLDKVIGDTKGDINTFKSRVPLDLIQKLHNFQAVSERVNNMPDIGVELGKFRLENSAKLTAFVASDIEPLSDRLSQVEAKTEGHEIHMKGMVEAEDKFKENLKSWKKTTDVNWQSLDSQMTSTISDVKNLRDLVTTSDQTSKQEVSALAQEVALLKTKAATPATSDLTKQGIEVFVKQEIARIGHTGVTPPTYAPTDPRIVQGISNDVKALKEGSEQEKAAWRKEIARLDLKMSTSAVQAMKTDLGTLQENISSHASTLQQQETRLLDCEENLSEKGYVKASQFSKCLDTLEKVKITVHSQGKTITALDSKLASQLHNVAPTTSMVPVTSGPNKVEELTRRILSDPDLQAIPLSKQWVVDWVGKEVGDVVNLSVGASLSIISDRLEEAVVQADKVGQVEAEVTRITNVVRNLSAVPGQVQQLETSLTAFGKNLDNVDKKHHDAVVNLHNRLYEPNGIAPHLEAISLACGSLESRYTNLNTGEMYRAMADQFSREHLPELQQILPLVESVKDVNRKILELEKADKNAKSRSGTPSSALQPGGNLQTHAASLEARNAQNALQTTVESVQENFLALEATIHDMKKRDLGKEVDSAHEDIVGLRRQFKEIKTDLSQVNTEHAQAKIDHEALRGKINELYKEYTINKKSLADQFADIELKFRNIARTVSTPSTATPSHHNAIRDRKASTPVTNGTSKINKRKFDHGRTVSPQVSVSSSSRASVANGSSSSHPAKKMKSDSKPLKQISNGKGGEMFVESDSNTNDDDEDGPRLMPTHLQQNPRSLL